MVAFDLALVRQFATFHRLPPPRKIQMVVLILLGNILALKCIKQVSALLVTHSLGFTCVTAAYAQDEEINLSPVVVTATKSERNVDDIPQSVTVITREQIAATPAQSVDELLQTVSGMDLTLSSSYQLHPTYSFPAMMGGRSGITSHVLVMLDGVPINDAYSGFVQWSRIPKENIERIEVVRGGGATLWGSYALSGVINVITREPDKAKFSIDAGYGSYGTYRADLYGTLINTDALKVSLNYGKFKTDGFNQVVPGSAVPGYPARPSGLYGKTSMDADNLQIVANYKIDPTLYGLVRFNYKNASQPESMMKAMTTNNDIYSLDFNVNKKLENNSLVTATGFYNHGKFETNNQSYADSYPPPAYTLTAIGGSFISNTHVADTDDVGGSLTWKGKFSDLIPDAMMGVDARQLQAHEHVNLFDVARDVNGVPIDTTSLFPVSSLVNSGDVKGKQRFTGIFGQVSIFPVDAWEISPSLRLQEWKNYGGYMFQAPPPSLGYSWSTGAQKTQTVDDLSWRLSTRYEVQSGFAFRAAAYKSFNAPTLDNLYRTYSAGGWAGYSNPTLKPERLYGQEIGFDAKVGNLKTDLTFFHNEIKDFLSYYIVADYSGSINDNVGTVRSYGMMLNSVWAINPNLDLRLGYTFTDSELVHSNGNVNDWLGQQIGLVPKNKLNLSATYKFDKFRTSLLARYVSKSYGANGTAQSSFMQDAFTVVDANVTYAYDKTTEISLDAANIFNKKYVANNDGWAPPLYGTPSTVFAGVRFNF